MGFIKKGFRVFNTTFSQINPDGITSYFRERK